MDGGRPGRTRLPVRLTRCGVKWTPLSERKAVAIADYQWYDILVKTRGQWIECFLDGQSVYKR
jgi:hypothetical protein